MHGLLPGWFALFCLGSVFNARFSEQECKRFTKVRSISPDLKGIRFLLRDIMALKWIYGQIIRLLKQISNGLVIVNTN